jgi:hypothetical protein
MDDGHQHTNPRVSPLLQVPCVLQQQIRSYIDANIWEIQNYHWQKKIYLVSARSELTHCAYCLACDLVIDPLPMSHVLF